MPSEPRIPTEPTLEELSAYLDHELDARAQARVADHVASGLARGFIEIRSRCGQDLGFLQQVATGLGERDAVPMSHEQRNPELVFQLSDMPAERWLRDVEPLGCSRDAGFFGHGEEGT